MTKIDFSDRSSRKDKRKKRLHADNLQGDFGLFEEYVDNSTGDYNYLWGDFIITLSANKKVLRKKFQKFLQKHLDEQE